MKSFNEYLVESKKTYKFKIKAAGELPENFTDKMETALNKYEVVSFNKGATTPIDKTPLDFPQIQFPKDHLIIDYQTQKNLEIKNTQRENNYAGSLLWSIDRTYTCMGARCLRRWIDSPLLNIDEINKNILIYCNFRFLMNGIFL